MKILSTEKWTEESKKKILGVLPDAVFLEPESATEFSELLGEAEILYGFPPSYVDAIAASKSLRLVHLMSTGVDAFMTVPFLESGIRLTNSRGVHAKPVAEHAMALLIGLVYHLERPSRVDDVRKWQAPHLERLEGRVVCLLGTGAIGKELARKCKAFDMEVLGFQRNPVMGREGDFDRLYGQDGLEEALGSSDYVICSLPLTQETRGMLTYRRFTQMKRGAYFVNVGRGPVVVEDDLVRALSEGVLRGAGLDVFEIEPLPSESPLWEMENVLITPHVGGHFSENADKSLAILVENLRRLQEGRPLMNEIDGTKEY